MNTEDKATLDRITKNMSYDELKAIKEFAELF